MSQKCWKKLIPGDLGSREGLPEVELGWGDIQCQQQLQGCLNHPHLFEKKQLQAVPGGENLGAGDPWDRLAVPGICWDIRSGALWSKSIHSTGTAQLFPQPESHWSPGRAPASADNGGESFIPQGKGVLFLHSDNPYFPITGMKMQLIFFYKKAN